MKLCPKCGTPQKDENTLCIECGAHLASALNDAEADTVQEKLAAEREKRVVYGGYFEADFYDPFTPNLKQRIVAGVDIALAVFALVSVIAVEMLPIKNPQFAVFTILYCGLAAFDLLVPEVEWNLVRFRAEIRGLETSDSPSNRFIFWSKLTDLFLSLLGAIVLAVSYLY